MRNIRARGVLAKINLALSDLPVLARLEGDPAPLRGRLLLARDINHLERAFDAAKYGQISPDPWLEICLPSLIDPSLAPTGGHMMSIYAHCAPRDMRGVSASAARDTLVRNVMSAIEPYMPGLSGLIVQRQVLLPEDLENGWGYRGGHIFHGESTLDQSWIARPQLGWAQYRTPIDGLFLGGAGTHPGGGLTGLSGLLAARTARKFLRKK
jgi:phytoene dehydrogenase-like protein